MTFFPTHCTCMSVDGQLQNDLIITIVWLDGRNYGSICSKFMGPWLLLKNVNTFPFVQLLRKAVRCLRRHHFFLLLCKLTNILSPLGNVTSICIPVSLEQWNRSRLREKRFRYRQMISWKLSITTFQIMIRTFTTRNSPVLKKRDARGGTWHLHQTITMKSCNSYFENAVDVITRP